MPEDYGAYDMVFGRDLPDWFIKTVAARVKRRLKKDIIKAGMKWIPSTFIILIDEPDEIAGPLSQITTVGIRVKCVPSKRR